MLVIFDLDGTLLNTIADLGTACNHALKALGYPTHSLDEYPRLVGNGVNKLIERALPAEAKTSCNRTHELIQRMRSEFIPYYNAHNLDLTRPYEGIVEMLGALKADGHRLAVASNKYQEATAKLVAHFFPETFDVVYGSARVWSASLIRKLCTTYSQRCKIHRARHYTWETVWSI